jgi:hypothetical protein
VTPDRGSIAPLVVVGELNADIVVALDAPPTFGQAEQIARATDVVLGSSSAITACGAARMDVPTALVSVRGDDLIGTSTSPPFASTSTCRLASRRFSRCPAASDR